MLNLRSMCGIAYVIPANAAVSALLPSTALTDFARGVPRTQAHATAAICGDGGVGLFHVGGTRGSLKLDIATSSLAVSVGGKVPRV